MILSIAAKAALRISFDWATPVVCFIIFFDSLAWYRYLCTQTLWLFCLHFGYYGRESLLTRRKEGYVLVPHNMKREDRHSGVAKVANAIVSFATFRATLVAKCSKRIIKWLQGSCHRTWSQSRSQSRYWIPTWFCNKGCKTRITYVYLLLFIIASYRGFSGWPCPPARAVWDYIFSPAPTTKNNDHANKQHR